MNHKLRYVLLRDHNIRLLSDKACIELIGQVDDSMYAKLINDIDIIESFMHNQSKNVIINLSTYGGDLYYALAIYDFLLALRAEGVNITIMCQGPVMSAGTVVLCAGDKVYAYPNAQFMMHYGSQEGSGQENFTDTENNTKHWKELVNRMVSILDTRLNVTKRTLNTWLQKDKYMDADNALEKGLIDNIVGKYES